MAQNILGLDLGAHAVKAVLLEGAFRGFSIAGSARAPLSADAAEPLAVRQAEAARALVAERGWRFDSVVISLPGAGVSSNVVTLPFNDLKRIEQTVGFEVEGQIPFDLADVAWDWQPLGSRPGKTDLLVAVARKDELSALLAALSGVGIDPRAVVPAAAAYASLFQGGAVVAAPPHPEGTAAEAEVVVDVGLERTNVSVVASGCEAARTFAFGSAHLARALARELSITEAEGTAVVAAAGGGPELPESFPVKHGDERVQDTLRRALAPLVRELRATLRAWRARAGQRPVARVALAGEVARLPVLAEALAPEAEGKVAPLELAGPAAQGIAPADAPGLALALALALRGQQGSHAPRLNLRRGDLAYTRDFEHVKGKVARLAAYAGLVVLLAIVSAGVKAFALARQESALDRSLCDAEERIVGRCFSSFEEAEAVLRGRGTAGASLPRISAVDAFAEVSERVPPDVPVRFDRIELTKDKLHLQGATGAAENVDRIASALKGSRCFADARSGGVRRRGTDSKFEFSVDASITCLDTGREASGGSR